MKSNQERSNECLPPKKREIPASNLPSDEKPVAVAPASESQRGENLAWLANVAGRHNSAVRHSGTPVETGLTQDSSSYKTLAAAATVEYSSSSSSRVPKSGATVAALPTVYPSSLSQPGGTIQYTQLPPNLQFISSGYTGPYTSYISSQLISPPATSAPTPPAQRAHLEAYTAAVISQASKIDQHHSLGRSPGLVAAGGTPPPTSGQPANQYVQIAGSPLGVNPRAVSSPPAHLSMHLHSHPAVIPHALALSGPSQVVVQYADGPSAKKEDGRMREMLNGELEKGRRYGLSPEAGLAKAKGASGHHHHHHQQQHQHQQQQQQHHYEARHVMLPADYSTHETSGLRTSLMLVPNSQANSGADLEMSSEKSPSCATNSDKAGGLCLGKPVARASSFTLSSSSSSSHLGADGLKATVTTLSPHTVIHTTHNATEQVSLGLSAAGFYPAATQPPIIGYIAGSGQQQPSVGYHANLPQHLVIPGNQPLLIPVSGSSGELESGPSLATTSQQFATVPHAFVTTTVPKCEPFGASEPQPPAPYHTAAVVQAQLHLPIVPATAPASVLPLPPASSSSSSSLPPYFMKGSIIQLADGELKRVEDLRTEDFIQSAEISSDLKIDSSTVERIDGSQTPNFAIIQFAVGEHRAQVSVEVLVEYPFFVFGQGWSSCCPERTTQLFELPCAKLAVGDVCISLTLKNLRNGSLKKSQPPDCGGGLLAKPPRADGPYGGRSRYAEQQENGLGQRAGAACRPPPLARTEPGGKPATRKRRWSAPESRKVEKSEEEPPLTLPKPSFIPQEVKICIEGRSNIGK
nr:PREDICTED: ataxin-1 [Lepisosteus oculatus]